MANRRDTLIDRVKREKLPALAAADAARLGEPDCIGLFGEAVAQYSRRRPRRTFFDKLGDGATFDVALPDGTLYSGAPAWVEGFSAVVAVEFPQGEREPVYLDAEDDYVLVPREAPTSLRLTQVTPTATQTLRVFYSVPHTVTDSLLTTPTADDDLLVNLTARNACLALAGAAADAKDSTIAGDSVAYRDIAQRYQALAKDYARLLPPEFREDPESTVPAASGWVDWDVRAQSGAEPVWHPRRLR